MKADRDAQTNELQALMSELSALQLQRDELIQNEVSVTELQSSSESQVKLLQDRLSQLETEQTDTESELSRCFGAECD
jgi:uncharacterized protein (DUF3084 family)